jgi:hypothetical protein
MRQHGVSTRGGDRESENDVPKTLDVTSARQQGNRSLMSSMLSPWIKQIIIELTGRDSPGQTTRDDV